MVNASRVMSDCGCATSARFLTEMARWIRALGPEGFAALYQCFANVRIDKSGDYAIPNASSAWLTRFLAKANEDYPGFRIRRASSVMDSE